MLSVHWPANVVRSAYRDNACSCCVEGTCCEAGRKGAGRHYCQTMCHARLCYREDFDDYCVKCIHVVCL